MVHQHKDKKSKETMSKGNFPTFTGIIRQSMLNILQAAYKINTFAISLKRKLFHFNKTTKI